MCLVVICALERLLCLKDVCGILVCVHARVCLCFCVLNVSFQYVCFCARMEAMNDVLMITMFVWCPFLYGCMLLCML